MNMDDRYIPSPVWLELGEGFSDPVAPAKFPKKILRYRNQVWAEKLGLGNLPDDEWIDHFAGFRPLSENLPQPLALRYHGHQFMNYNPELGDGRGFLFAQLRHEGKIYDLGTKGSGQTPYSRRGDGRLTLKGAFREALATELLSAFGVNTSKTFSFIETGEQLQRNDEPSPTRSAVLVRLSQGHIRIGTFQRLAFLNEKENMVKLLAYCNQYYFAECTTGPDDAVGFHREVCRQVAKTGAQWMIHGFVHGVLNTDNINVTGESFDYGPYRFLPHFDSHFTAAYFDQSGLYAYGQQPNILFWNLQQLEQSLKLMADLDFTENYDVFQDTFNHETMDLFCRKLNITHPNPEKLFKLTIQFLDHSKVDFAGFYFDWLGGQLRSGESPRNSYYQGALFDDFNTEMKKALPRHGELFKNPYFQNANPEFLLIDEIENLWNSIAEKDDWTPFYEKISRLRRLPPLPL